MYNIYLSIYINLFYYYSYSKREYILSVYMVLQILFDEHGPPHHTTPHPSLIHTTLTIGEIGEICEKKSIKWNNMTKKAIFLIYVSLNIHFFVILFHFIDFFSHISPISHLLRWCEWVRGVVWCVVRWLMFIEKYSYTIHYTWYIYTIITTKSSFFLWNFWFLKIVKLTKQTNIRATFNCYNNCKLHFTIKIHYYSNNYL